MRPNIFRVSIDIRTVCSTAAGTACSGGRRSTARSASQRAGSTAAIAPKRPTLWPLSSTEARITLRLWAWPSRSKPTSTTAPGCVRTQLAQSCQVLTGSPSRLSSRSPASKPAWDAAPPACTPLSTGSIGGWKASRPRSANRCSGSMRTAVSGSETWRADADASRPARTSSSSAPRSTTSSSSRVRSWVQVATGSPLTRSISSPPLRPAWAATEAAGGSASTGRRPSCPITRVAQKKAMASSRLATGPAATIRKRFQGGC